MKLIQREWCPGSTKVREVLAKLNLSYEIVNVPRLGTERTAVLELEGIESPEVPVLVDGDRTLQGSDLIISHLMEKYAKPTYGDPRYGITRVIKGMTFGDALAAARTALAAEGFGVLTEIDVKATMRKKLDVDFTNYVILGACNPPLAHQALTAEPAIGLLLPCNVVVSEESDGSAVVSAVDPMALFGVLRRPELEPVAKEVNAKLKRVIQAIGS